MGAIIRSKMKGGEHCHWDEVGVTPINDEVTLGLPDRKRERKRQCSKKRIHFLT